MKAIPLAERRFSRFAGAALSLLTAAAMLMPSSASAFVGPASTYPQDTELLMTGPGISLTIVAGSADTSLDVTSTTFTVTVPSGSTFTARYPGPNPGRFPNNGSLSECRLVGGNNDFLVTGPKTVTVTPSTTRCSSGGGGAATPPSVDLFQPNGGAFAAGDSTLIIWSTGGDGIVGARLSLSTDGGATYPTQIGSNLPGNSYAWTVPNVTTTRGRVRIEALDASGFAVASDASSADFAITGGSSDLSQGTEGSATDTEEGLDMSSGRDAMPRAQADAHLPTAFPADSLVKLPDDGNPGTDSDTTVYYLGLDAKRHPFINAAAYASWYQDFKDVKTIDGTTLASIPLGAPVLVRPGTFWVKIVSDPRTYYVAPGYRLRWIKDEATAVVLGGPDWNKNIVDVDTSFFALYSSGPAFERGDTPTAAQFGTLIDSSVNRITDRYLLGLRVYDADGIKRPFASQEAFDANHFQERFVHFRSAADTPDAAFEAMPTGAPITGFEDALFSLLH